MSTLDEPTESGEIASEECKYLVFRLANEFYASPLVSIREIIKMQPIKSVPFMVSYFRGILNLRGMIISVVDLRMKLEIPDSDLTKGLLVVVDSEAGAIAAIVDDVVSVHDFPPDKIERKIQLKTKIPVEFFIGIGHLNDRLVNIINIGATLTSSDFAVVRRILEPTDSGRGAA